VGRARRGKVGRARRVGGAQVGGPVPVPVPVGHMHGRPMGGVHVGGPMGGVHVGGVHVGGPMVGIHVGMHGGPMVGMHVHVGGPVPVPVGMHGGPMVGMHVPVFGGLVPVPMVGGLVPVHIRDGYRKDTGVIFTEDNHAGDVLIIFDEFGEIERVNNGFTDGFHFNVVVDIPDGGYVMEGLLFVSEYHDLINVRMINNSHDKIHAITRVVPDRVVYN